MNDEATAIAARYRAVFTVQWWLTGSRVRAQALAIRAIFTEFQPIGPIRGRNPTHIIYDEVDR